MFHVSLGQLCFEVIIVTSDVTLQGLSLMLVYKKKTCHCFTSNVSLSNAINNI